MNAQDRPRRLKMRMLRAAPFVFLLAGLVGVVLLAVAAGLSGYVTRTDGFAILGRGKNRQVTRLDLPDGWRLAFRPMKNGTATAMFAADGSFAFEVSHEAASVYDPETKQFRTYRSVEEFAERHAVGAETEIRTAPTGERVAVVRRRIEDQWTERWKVASDGAVVQVTYYTAPQRPCVRFVIRSGDAARFDPEAYRMYSSAQLLPETDPRANNSLPDPPALAWKARLREAGGWVLGTAVVGFFASFYVALAVVVMDASRGSPDLCVVGPPTVPPEQRGPLSELEGDLPTLGFRHAGWFSLDDFDETHVSAWRHESRPDVAFVMYVPATAACRVRIVHRFADGWVLVSSTRRVDLSYRPPPSVYRQVRRHGPVGELWDWHLAALDRFPRRSARTAEESPSPIELYTDLVRRIGRDYRRGWLWFVRWNPFGECWRIWRWCGVSVPDQIDRGWVLDPALTFPEPERHDD